jgi:hypothetical protein
MVPAVIRGSYMGSKKMSSKDAREFEAEMCSKLRTNKELCTAFGELLGKVSYRNYKLIAKDIEEGTVRVADEKGDCKSVNGEGVILRDSLEGLKKQAEWAAKRYDGASLEYKDEFEWGVLVGKFCALKWVLGGSWKMCDCKD